MAGIGGVIRTAGTGQRPAAHTVLPSANQVDFTGLSMAALRALGPEDSPTDLALYLDYRIGHILVDEYQDVSINQYELLEKLTAGWSMEDGHSLFLVGDPMQSIYRFREAEVGVVSCDVGTATHRTGACQPGENRGQLPFGPNPGGLGEQGIPRSTAGRTRRGARRGQLYTGSGVQGTPRGKTAYTYIPSSYMTGVRTAAGRMRRKRNWRWNRSGKSAHYRIPRASPYWSAAALT